MLILTPKPHPTECISGYLHSLSTANGYSNPSWIIEPYRNGYHGDDYRRVTPDVIRRISGLAGPEADRVCVRPDREGDRTTIRLVGTELHVSHVCMQGFRICPQCVAEHGRHEAFWHLRLVQWCPIHRAPLLDTCRACHAKLRWNRPRVGRCNCGADLTEQTGAGRCPKPLANLLLVVRAALYGDVSIDAARPAKLAHLFHLDLYRLMRMLETLEDLVPRCDQNGAPGEQQGECDALANVAHVLANWPRSFQHFLQKRYGEELEGDGSRRSFKITFSWAFWTLGRNLEEHAHQLQFLRDEVMRFGACHWTREQLMRTTPRMALMKLQCEWGSIPDAASLMGIDPRTLLKRIGEGLVPIRESNTIRGSRNYKVNMSWARGRKYSARPSMGMREAATLLGISTALLSALRTLRVYQARTQTRRLGGYAAEDVEVLKYLLDDVVNQYFEDGLVAGILVDGRRFDRIGSPLVRAQILQNLIQLVRTPAIPSSQSSGSGGASGRPEPTLVA